MRLRRKKDDEASTSVDAAVGESDGSTDAAATASSGPSGPYDVDDLPEDGRERVDLGSLLIAPEEGRDVRLQVDEASGQIQSVMLAGADGAIEVRAFAAPRNGDLWSEVMPQIAADMARRGGTATEREGRYGTELVCQVTVQQQGGTAVQPSRIVGINGPRWLLRATFLGKPAVEFDDEGWDAALAAIAVRRGAQAMPVGEALPLVLPDSARRMPPG